MTDSPEPQDPTNEGSEIAPTLTDSDFGTTDAITEPLLEMPDPAPEAESGPGTGTFTHVVPLPSEASELQLAYECLEIHTPIQEFQTYANARLETLIRLGETERAEITSQALELGLGALRRVMGAVSKEAP